MLLETLQLPVVDIYECPIRITGVRPQIPEM